MTSDAPTRPAAVLRPYRHGDLDGLYAVCVATGDSGKDGRHLYADPRTIGDVYAAPYGVLAPELVVVAEDAEGIAGYAVGVLDTAAWEARLEAEWWPEIRPRYAAPDWERRAEWSEDERRRGFIHRPTPIPPPVVAAYPGHMHLNLLPRLQGHGLGRALCRAWLDTAKAAGIGPLHIGSGKSNPRAIAYWQAMGFRPLDLPESVAGRAVWMGRESAD